MSQRGGAQALTKLHSEVSVHQCWFLGLLVGFAFVPVRIPAVLFPFMSAGRGG